VQVSLQKAEQSTTEKLARIWKPLLPARWSPVVKLLADVNHSVHDLVDGLVSVAKQQEHVGSV